MGQTVGRNSMFYYLTPFLANTYYSASSNIIPRFGASSGIILHDFAQPHTVQHYQDHPHISALFSTIPETSINIHHHLAPFSTLSNQYQHVTLSRIFHHHTHTTQHHSICFVDICHCGPLSWQTIIMGTLICQGGPM